METRKLWVLFAVTYTMMLAPKHALGEGLSTSSDPLPMCNSSFEENGEIASGFFSTVTSTTPFDSATSPDSVVDVYSGSIRTGLEMVVFAGARRGPYADGGSIAVDAGAGQRTRIDFYKDDEVVFACNVIIGEYSKQEDELSQLSVGDCEMLLQSGSVTLRSGHIQIFELPNELVELVGNSPEIVDISPLTSTSFQVTGVSEGQGQFVWVNEAGEIGGICPISVSGRIDRLADRDLCTDIDGMPLRLTPGEVVELRSYNDPDSRWAHNAVRIGDDKSIGLMSLDGEERILRIIAGVPGTTSVVFRPTLAASPQVCGVEVREAQEN